MSERDAARRITAIAAAAELGGAERVLLDFATHAFEHGIALRVLAPRHGPLIDLLNNLGIPAETVAAPTSLLRASQRPEHVTSLLPAIMGLRSWARRLAAHRWYRDAEAVYSLAFAAHLATALTNQAPVIWHLHKFPPARMGSIWRMLNRRFPDASIANSHAVADAWGRGKRVQSAIRRRQHPDRREWGWPIAVIPNGVDLDRFKPRERTHWIHNELCIPWEARLVGMPAVFARWKGQLEVIEAFEALSEEHSEVHLVIVGGSIYDTHAELEFGETLVQRIAASPRESRLHLLPFQHRIEHVYPEFDLTVHYSTRPEPFGRVVIESMACGVPVIAAAEGGPIEILGGGIGPRRSAGWLAEPRDPGALTRLLRSALELSPEIGQSIGEAGRRRAEDCYSARAFAARVSQVLLSVARRGGGTRRQRGWSRTGRAVGCCRLSDGRIRWNVTISTTS